MVLAFPMVAYLSSSFSLDEAVEQIQENDLDGQKVGEPSLDEDIQIYQQEFADELEDIQDISEEYQEDMEDLSRELQSYNSVYEYWSLNEQARISEDGLELAENQLEILEAQFEQGLVSEGQLIEMEQSINSQKAQNRSLQEQLNSMKMMLNQDLKQPLKSSLAFSQPKFERLAPATYEAETVADEMTSSHESLRVPRTIVATYDDILDDIENLDRISGPSTSELRSARSDLNDQLDEKEKELGTKMAELEEKETDEETNPEELDKLNQEIRDLSQDIGLLESQKGSLDFQIEMLNAQAPDAASRSKAEEELTDYYEDMLNDARIDLTNQVETIELMAFQYEEQFTSLEDQLDLLEENRNIASDLYNKEMARLEQGMSRQSEVDEARQSIEQAEVEVIQLQKDYMLAKKEFELFTEEGYLPQQER